jgi:hypothetical protein
VVHCGLKTVHRLYFKLSSFNTMQPSAVLLTGDLSNTTSCLACYTVLCTLCQHVLIQRSWCSITIVGITFAEESAIARATLRACLLTDAMTYCCFITATAVVTTAATTAEAEEEL